MATLHVISQPEALSDCLAVAVSDDEIILLGDAVKAAFEDHGRRLWGLEEDIAEIKKDTLSEHVKLTDYSGFVDLVARCKPVVTWH